jgi:hypothetical protein
VTDNPEGTDRPSFTLNGVILNPKVTVAREDLILVSRDRLLRCLQGVTDSAGRRDRWMVPLALLVPLVLALTTTNFTRRFGIDAGEWETAVTMLSFFALGWLAYELKHRKRSATPESIVEELTKGSVEIGLSAVNSEPPFNTNQSDQPSHSRPVNAAEQAAAFIGDRITHPRYGGGTVQSISVAALGRSYARVKFDESARLKRIRLPEVVITKLLEFEVCP